jgi:hypothetical protein
VATFPGKPPNPLGIKVELNLASVWTDITAYVQLRNLIAISNMGRVDETAGMSACQLTLTLNNRDGRFTPKNTAGAYYPNILRNTQVRVSVNATSATGVNYSGYRFWGEVSSWPPAWDVSQHDIYVSLTAAGIWRRITQSSVPIGSAFSRYVKLLTGTAFPAAWWAMEDGSGSAAFVLTGGSGTNMTPTTAPSMAADGTSFPGSDALPQPAGSRLAANVSAGPSPVNNVVQFALSVPAANDSNEPQYTSGMIIVTVLASGTAGRVDVSLVGTQLQIAGYATGAGGTPLFSGTIATKVTGVPVLVSMEITPSGSAVNWALRIIKPGAGTALDQVTGTRATSSVAAVTQVQVNPQGRLADTTVGQVGVYYQVPVLASAAFALGGNAGETAIARFGRLCTESNIPYVTIGTGGATMGPQADDTMSAVLQSVEDTDGGLLYEPPNAFGLGYRTLASMQNQAAGAVLDYTSGVLGAPPAPTYDDQLVRNDVTITNYDGYVAHAVLTAGALSVQPPPNGTGQYASSGRTNASAHAQVNAIAQQKLFLGTADEIRFPAIEVNFQRTAAAPHFADVPGLRVGDYFQLASMPAFAGAATSKQIAWGYSEQLGGNPQAWAITFNAVPELPFETTFSPGTWAVNQAAGGAVAAGSPVGATVNGAQIGAGSVSSPAIQQTLSARTLGGITQFVAAATPYAWSFAVTGTPADATYFSCTQEQSLPITVGDTFSSTGAFGGPFTVTDIGASSGGVVPVHFTPAASAVMSSGTVQGGKNGDQWINTSAGNQVNLWSAGGWVPVTWNAQNVITAGSITATQIQAGTITATQIAAGTVIAGAVDGTTITGATVIDTGGGYWGYNGTPASGNLFYSDTVTSGTDAYGNAYLAGITFYGSPSAGVWIAVNYGVTNAAFGPVYYTASSSGGPWTIDAWLRRSSGSAGQLEIGPILELLSTGLLPATPAGGAKFFVPSNTNTPRVMKTDGEPGYGIGETIYSINADQTISTGWATGISAGGINLSVPVASGQVYFFEATFWVNLATSFAINVGFTGPAVSACQWFFQGSTSSTMSPQTVLTFVAPTPGAGDYVLRAWGNFTPSASGTFSMAAGRPAANNFTVKAGTYLRVRTHH